MFGSGDGFPFMVGGAPASVTSAHPSPIQMFQLWQVYISNVNPLLKITHTPTLQADIISASANPSKISRPLEALMFAIYFSAVTSLTEDEVQTMFGEDRSILLGRYHNATQQALVNAEFMKSTELAVLQAFFLYLVLTRLFTWPKVVLDSISANMHTYPVIGPPLCRPSVLVHPPRPGLSHSHATEPASRWHRLQYVTIRGRTAASTLVADCRLRQAHRRDHGLSHDNPLVLRNHHALASQYQRLRLEHTGQGSARVLRRLDRDDICSYPHRAHRGCVS